jgi:hypothetical protein
MEPGQRIVTAWELQNELIALCAKHQPSTPPFIDSSVDATYWLPSRQFVEREFSDLVNRLNSRYGMFWEQESRDCDDYVAMAISWMLLCFWRSGIHDAAVAFLRCNLRIVVELNGITASNHCAVLCRTKEEWIVYEPQNQRITPLEVALATGSAVLLATAL